MATPTGNSRRRPIPHPRPRRVAGIRRPVPRPDYMPGFGQSYPDQQHFGYEEPLAIGPDDSEADTGPIEHRSDDQDGSYADDGSAEPQPAGTVQPVIAPSKFKKSSSEFLKKWWPQLLPLLFCWVMVILTPASLRVPCIILALAATFYTAWAISEKSKETKPAADATDNDPEEG